MPDRPKPFEGQKRQRRLTPSMAIAGVALVLALCSGSAFAAGSLIHAGDIAVGAITSRAIKNGQIMPRDLNPLTRNTLKGDDGPKGDTGSTGAAGADGTNGLNGPNGANGANGPNGANGADGDDGTNGTDGIDGVDGIDGTIAPLFATSGGTPIPTSASYTAVVSLPVPAGDYVVLAKSQLSHTGAGDSIDCLLKAGATTIDQVAMKTMPALAAIPMSMQAVLTAPSPVELSVQCHVLTANGSADFSSLIAIPTG